MDLGRNRQPAYSLLPLLQYTVSVFIRQAFFHPDFTGSGWSFTLVMTTQASAINIVPKINNQRYWLSSTSTKIPPKVGPSTAANCDEK